MDRGCKVLHYPNMNFIPTYALYGETQSEHRQDWLHWETIQARSRLHDYRIAPHRHEQFFQVLYLTAGRAEMVLDGDSHVLLPECVAVVPAGVVHASFNVGTAEARLTAILGPCVGDIGYVSVEVGDQSPWNTLR